MLVILGFAIVKVNVYISSLMENNAICPSIPGLFLIPCPISLQPFSGSEEDLVLCSSLVFFQLSVFHLCDDKGGIQNASRGFGMASQQRIHLGHLVGSTKSWAFLKGLDLEFFIKTISFSIFNRDSKK